MKIKTMAGICLAATAAACSIKQNVQPVSLLAQQEICVIQNDAVRAEFLTAINRSLSSWSYQVTLLDQGSPVTSCPVTMAYVANWSWDVAVYMTYAQLDVYQDGAISGSAVYDARSGGANMGKFINAEAKVDELIGQLFQKNGAGN
ncbi:MAG: hypothetical protein CME88_05090 [Hirschia sp.]|nr:hypothetical protein [Hirschia sp.]MBF17738.1 hypothetical protein [Hirschia sp.]